MEIMVDIETLALTPDAAIVQIGAVQFEFGKGIGETFMRNIEMQDALHGSRAVDLKTVEWWLRNHSAPLVFSAEPRVPLRQALHEFVAFIPLNFRVWGKGYGFDITILEHALREYSIAVPWKYNQIFDARTLFTLARHHLRPTCAEDWQPPLRGTSLIEHDARCDAIHQAGCAMSALEWLEVDFFARTEG